jgi:hypothetical protein
MKSLRAFPVVGSLALFCILAVVAQGAQAQTAAPAKIGSSLIGKLEGPEIILDAKAIRSRSRKRRPGRAGQGRQAAVARQALPEPSQLFVVKPLREIGNTAATGGARSRDPPTTRTAAGSSRSTRS